MPIFGGDSHARSIVKAVSWRATGSVDTFVLSWLITGSVKFAGSIASVEVVTKIVLYYCHERVWAVIPFGRRLAEPDAELRGGSKPAPLPETQEAA
ncbi:MAG: DUF2061 domain-containing protein [Pararhizobium sp.]